MKRQIERAVVIGPSLMHEFRAAVDERVGQPHMPPEEGRAGLGVADRGDLLDMRARFEVVAVEEDIMRDGARLAADEAIDAPIAGAQALEGEIFGAGVVVDMRRPVIDAQIAPDAQQPARRDIVVDIADAGAGLRDSIPAPAARALAMVAPFALVI